MRFARILSFAALAVIGLGSAIAAPVVPGRFAVEPERAVKTTVVSGVYQVTLNLNVASTLPNGSTVTCKAAIVPALRSLESSEQLPFESASSAAAIANGTGSCVVEIPFSWSLSSASNGVWLSFEVDAVNATGTLPAVIRVSAQKGLPVAYPAAGGTSSVSYNVTF